MGKKNKSRRNTATPAAALPGEPSAGTKTRVGLLVLLGVCVAALVLRLWVNSASLWYDELYTIAFHVSRPWGDIVSRGPYSANNHVLSTLLIKGVVSLTGSLTPLPNSPLPVMLANGDTLSFRLVSIIAGAGLPLALAWKLREQAVSAGLLALLAAAHPWLIDLSTEARGYALTLLLAAIAANCLAGMRERFSWGYVLTMAAAVYTLPIAGEILLAHGVAMALLHRPGLWRWALAAGIVAGLSVMLYLPFLGGIVHHIGVADPDGERTTAASYLLELGQHLASGWRWGPVWLAAAVGVVLLAGAAAAWRRAELRDALVTYGAGTVLAILCAAFDANMRGTRLALWAAPLFVVACAGLVLAARGIGTSAAGRRGRALAGAGLGAAMWAMFWSTSLIADFRLAAIEPQPILTALRAADASLGDRKEHEGAIVCVYMSASESLLYWQLLHHDQEIVYKLSDLAALEKTPRELRLVIFYEDAMGAAQGELAEHIQAHYVLQERLPGRISPVAIYGPRLVDPADHQSR